MILFLSLKSFFTSVFQSMCTIFTVVVSILAYLIGYPAVQTMLIAALVLFLFDIGTRFYAIAKQNGGLYNAFYINKKFTSKAFWNGFITKVIGYFVILTIANFALITPQLALVGAIISTILYVALFFYEAISNLENLAEAGFKLSIPLLKKVKKEQDKFLNDNINPVTSEITTETNKESNG